MKCEVFGREWTGGTERRRNGDAGEWRRLAVGDAQCGRGGEGMTLEGF